MATTEFDVIRHYFDQQTSHHPSTLLAIGDDAALIQPDPHYELAITTDTLVEGVHFTTTVDPRALGYKALAVNLSDLAAMGAIPRWITLSLTLPETDKIWLKQFSKGLFSLAAVYSIDLIGGDTSKGPLAVTIQAIGLVKPGKAMCRSTAEIGDFIYVTGTIGDAGLALKIEQGDYKDPGFSAFDRLHRPIPRIEAGIAINEFASACIDISDGLASDLGHILSSSRVGANIEWERLPLSEALRKYVEVTKDWALPVNSGDDYELCVTVPKCNDNQFRKVMQAIDCRYSQIGIIERELGLRIEKDSNNVTLVKQGYEHFTS